MAWTRLRVIQSHKYNPAEQGQLWMTAGLVESGRWNNEDKSYGQ